MLAETFWDLFHDPAHWYFELFVGFIEMVVFDLIFGLLLWQKWLKPYLQRRKAEIIKQEHERHGIEEEH